MVSSGSYCSCCGSDSSPSAACEIHLPSPVRCRMSMGVHVMRDSGFLSHHFPLLFHIPTHTCCPAYCKVTCPLPGSSPQAVPSALFTWLQVPSESSAWIGLSMADFVKFCLITYSGFFLSPLWHLYMLYMDIWASQVAQW